ncbi:MAG TPA: LysR family transcriptional regulator [Candidatus Udaeobacter sp.]|nr:LysR family transcriptional regulator [Candidatus Udaeobacter sp.]
MLLDRIELFVTVAKNQNLAKTARGMHVSASSVCQRLKTLENDFGVKLYKKNKEGIELTGAGQTFLTTASEVLDRLQILKNTLSKNSETAVQSLTVAGTYNPSAKYLPAAIAIFQKTRPDVKVRFLTSNRSTIEKLVREAEVDIAVVQGATKPADVNVEHFATDRLAFFTHPTHPLAKKKRLALGELCDAPLITREETGTTAKMLKQIQCQGLSPNVSLRCASPEAVKAAVRQKMGIGVLFYTLVEEDIKRKTLKKLNFAGLPNLVGNSYIIFSRSKPLSGAASDFLAVLRSIKDRLKGQRNSSQDNSD